MPTSPSSSIGSPDPYATASVPADKVDHEAAAPPVARLQWRLPALLFVLTVASILFTKAREFEPFRLANGVSYAVALLAILLTHEFAHYFFARHHRVNASLPHFIPMPLPGSFGTMGAVILMRDRIKSKNALLDIGASGPIAGLLVAIPIILYGLAHSDVRPLDGAGSQEGQSVIYWLMKRIAIGPIPEGSDVFINPVASAGWVGLFVTMLNLVPVGQLDGGHVAYALFGPRQNWYSKVLRWSLLALVPINFVWHIVPGLLHGLTDSIWRMATTSSLPWLVWFIVLTLLERLSGGGHPPTERGELSPLRRVIAIGTLILFVLLFMPTPMMSY
jgi:membrane-associated protease RseP (regulator of RpoE activity)